MSARKQEKGYIRYEDLPLKTRDGRREVEFVSNVYRVEDHMVIQCNIRDITERRRAEEELREGGRRKDEFLAMLPHELATALPPSGRRRDDAARRRGRPRCASARDAVERQVDH